MGLRVSGNVRVSKVFKREDKFTSLSVSFADKKGEAWEWSNMTATLVGTAHAKFAGMDEGDWLTLDGAVLKNVPYTKKDGTKEYKNHDILVFDFSLRTNEKLEQKAAPTKAVTPPEDDIPF